VVRSSDSIRGRGDGIPGPPFSWGEGLRNTRGGKSSFVRSQVFNSPAWVRGLCDAMKIPPLRVAGLSTTDCGRLIPLAQGASSMKGNPVKLSDEELRGILESSL
jgi:alcohol dehydrogenase class IV